MVRVVIVGGNYKPRVNIFKPISVIPVNYFVRFVQLSPTDFGQCEYLPRTGEPPENAALVLVCVTSPRLFQSSRGRQSQNGKAQQTENQ